MDRLLVGLVLTILFFTAVGLVALAWGERIRSALHRKRRKLEANHSTPKVQKTDADIVARLGMRSASEIECEEVRADATHRPAEFD